jgi:hypothetical protein
MASSISPAPMEEPELDVRPKIVWEILGRMREFIPVCMSKVCD